MSGITPEARWHFVIQTDRWGVPAQDFGYALKEAIEWAAWRYDASRYDFTLAAEWPDRLAADPDRVVPIGSLEWVESWMQRQFARALPRPIYIPEALRTPFYLHRDLRLVAGPVPRQPQRVFIKQATRYKGIDVQLTDRTDLLSPDEYWISDVVDFRTEWRAFIYRHQLVGLQNYGGDFTLMPDIAVVQAMIGAYTDAPVAYTLDVGVLETGETAVVEVHPLVSCGLYGFADLAILPAMTIAGWRDILKTDARSS